MIGGCGLGRQGQAPAGLSSLRDGDPGRGCGWVAMGGAYRGSSGHVCGQMMPSPLPQGAGPTHTL